ncbi:HEPN domain-containing protein [Phascolarctobacterium sp.]
MRPCRCCRRCWADCLKKLSQQAAEKALKAIIIAKESQGGIPKIHDLEFC